MTAVLLTLDRSEKDQRAISAAEAFAELAYTDIHLVYVLGGVAGLDASQVSAGAAARLEDACTWLETMRRRVRAPSGRDVTMEVVVSIGSADAILNIALRNPPEMIVMATRAPGTLGRAVHGSVADEVVRRSARPVVLMPPGAVVREHRASLRRVLMPVDGSHDPLRMVDWLLSFAGASSLQFVLFQAVRAESTGKYLMPPVLPAEGAEDTAPVETGLVHVNLGAARGALNRIAERIGARPHGTEVKVVEAPDPATAIINAATSESIDFIAMTTKGIGGFRRVVAGSVATAVTQASPVPVLLSAGAPEPP
jgi:nucleotide-binding universal stress UspA family protein